MAMSATRVRYVADQGTSQFTVQAFASGLIAVVAHSPKIAIRDWTGTVDLTDGIPDSASLHVQVNAASLEVLDELADADRREIHRVMNREVLETDRFPEIVYASTKVTADKLKEDNYRISVTGRLTLHGVSSDQDLVGQAAFGVDSARFYGTFKLLQSDYGIRIASIAGGTLKLQDELKFSFYVVARKAD